MKRKGLFRLTGGQANLIAGIKDGDKGLNDDEKGFSVEDLARGMITFKNAASLMKMKSLSSIFCLILPRKMMTNMKRKLNE